MANIEEQMKIYPHITDQIFNYLDLRCLNKMENIYWNIKIFTRENDQGNCGTTTAIYTIEIQRQWNRFLLIADNKKIKTVLCLMNWGEFRGINKDFSPLYFLSKMEDSLELYKDICKACEGNVIKKILKIFNIQTLS